MFMFFKQIVTLCLKIYISAEKLVRCHLGDPNLDECLNKAIYNAIQFIGSKGK